MYQITFGKATYQVWAIDGLVAFSDRGRNVFTEFDQARMPRWGYLTEMELPNRNTRLIKRMEPRHHFTRAGGKTEIVFPIWYIPSLMAIPVGFGIWTIRRNRRNRRNGLCRSCGYDLTGNTSGRCPECGCNIHMTNPAA
jgi:hypothetical protein